MERIIYTFVLWAISVKLIAQSVYMHEAQKDAGGSDGFSFLGIITLLLFIGLFYILKSLFQGKTSKKENIIQKPKSKTKQLQISPVDLGLSVLWANCNIGATSIYDGGEIYAWGKKDKYIRFIHGLKGNADAIGNISGNTRYDVATQKLGYDWRMPTYEEGLELIEKCQWEEVKENLHSGIKITGPNGNTLFIPFNGCRNNLMLDNEPNVLRHALYLWLSTPNQEWACSLEYNINDKEKFGCPRIDNKSVRNSGYGIRAVKNKV